MNVSNKTQSNVISKQERNVSNRSQSNVISKQERSTDQEFGYKELVDLLINSNLKLRFLTKKEPKKENKKRAENFVINQSDINFDPNLDQVDIYKFLKVKDLINIPKYVVPRFKY